MKKSVTVIAVLAGLLIAGQAQANSITGEIAFGFVVTPIDAQGQQVGLGAATGLRFDNPMLIAASGVYANPEALSPFVDVVSINTFQFDPALNPNPVDPLWSVTHAANSKVFSFTLSEIDVDLHSDTQLNLTGLGMLHGPGYDDTVGTWNFQAGSSSGGLQALVTFRADSANTDAGGGGTPVPDSGTTAMLLGLALTSLGFLSRRFAS